MSRVRSVAWWLALSLAAATMAITVTGPADARADACARSPVTLIVKHEPRLATSIPARAVGTCEAVRYDMTAYGFVQVGGRRNVGKITHMRVDNVNGAGSPVTLRVPASVVRTARKYARSLHTQVIYIWLTATSNRHGTSDSPFRALMRIRVRVPL